MSDIVTLNGYKIKDEKAVRSYESVAQMKADNKLRVGQHVKTKGYYIAGDGGGAEYVIKTSSIKFYESLTNNLVAELIDDEYNILKIGAKLEDEDCSSYIISMLDKYKKVYMPKGIYNVNNKIILDGEGTYSFDFKCEGTINSTVSNDYTIELKNTGLSKVYIDELLSNDCGGILLSNDTNNNTIEVRKMIVNSSDYRCIALKNDDTKIITCNNFYGKLWISKLSEVVYIENGEGTNISGFNTENNFHNINVQSWNDYIVFINDLSTNSETQVNLYGCNLETGKGIKSYGRVSHIGLYDCRVQEMLNKNNCIYIIKCVPYIEITGFGIFDPSKVKFENISFWTDHSIYTNMSLKDNTFNKVYSGGGNVYYNHFVPLNIKGPNNMISLTSSDVNYTVQVNNNGGIVNTIVTDVITKEDITITIPDYLAEITDNLIIQSYNIGHNVTIKNTSNNSISYTTTAWGREMIILKGNKPFCHFRLS